MPVELPALAALSARLGQDPEQIQAAGGNSSIKEDGVMWVKASGLWLADAESDDLFVPIDLAKFDAALAAGATDPAKPAVIQERNPKGLRPSIETSLHALVRRRFVIHTHSVRTIALAIREDWRERCTERLTGIEWGAVPYAKPGLDLTRAMQAATAGQNVDVLILGNHGIVVAGDELLEVEQLLAEIERRLDSSVAQFEDRTPSTPPAGWRHVKHAICHRLAFHPGLRDLAVAGSYYPDHVIFLGDAASVEEPDKDVAKLWLHPTAGALLPVGSGPSEDEMVRCLLLVLERVPTGARLSALSESQIAALLNWDAEKYRQALAKRA